MADLRLIDSTSAPDPGFDSAPQDERLPDAEAFDAYSRTVSGVGERIGHQLELRVDRSGRELRIGIVPRELDE
jgi:hypothetical protein